MTTAPFFLYGQRVDIYDNQGATSDRFTAVFTGQIPRKNQGMLYYPALSMNCEPYHPTGIGMHIECPTGNHLGKRITFASLPEDCQKFVTSECPAYKSINKAEGK